MDKASAHVAGIVGSSPTRIILFFHSVTAEKSHVLVSQSNSKDAPKVFSPGKTWLERAHLAFKVLSRAYLRLHTSLIRRRSGGNGDIGGDMTPLWQDCG